MSEPRVVIYRDFLLPKSETFIRSQAEGLSRFEPHYAGLALVEDGLPLDARRTHIVQRGPLGKLHSALFTRTGLAPKLALELFQLKPRLIHAHFGVDGTRVMRLAGVLRLPLLVTLHDYDITTSDSDLMKLAPYCRRYIARRPRLMRKATAFLAVSDFIKQKAVARGFPAHKILVHYIGIDTSRFTPERAREGEVVLFVGRLVQKKGCRYLLEAMAKVQAARPDAELVIVGTGPLQSELEARAAATLGKYRFLGALAPDQVREWYRRATLFCAPSVTADSGETEGLPITVMEAQATALPVVSTYHSGIPEAVADGETGLLVKECDSEALADRILTLLQDPSRAERLGDAARASVLQRFDMKRQIGLLEDVYQQLSERPHDVPQLRR